MNYNKEYVVKERFEKKVDYFVTHDHKIIGENEKIEIKKAKTMIKLNKLNQQLYAYKNLLNICYEEKNKLYDDKLNFNNILDNMKETIENLFRNYNTKTIDIVYQSIIIASKEDYSYCNTNYENKIKLIIKWLRDMKKE